MIENQLSLFQQEPDSGEVERVAGQTVENTHSDSTPFLKQVALSLIQTYKEDISDIHIVLPSRRACLYMKYYLSQLTERSIIAPEIISIDDFISQLAEVEVLDHLNLLFDLYNTYKQFDSDENHNLEKFAPLGTVILKDFDMIDKNMVDGEKLFESLTEIKAIERWRDEFKKEVEISENSTINNYYAFWNHLDNTYRVFREQLAARNKAYPGMAYRWVAENVEHIVSRNHFLHIAFAGFNQLSASEESLIRQLVDRKLATIFWDMDRFYVEKTLHEAGHYFRKFVQKDKKLSPQEMGAMVQDEILSRKKNIDIISVTNKVTQGKLVGELLEKIMGEVTASGQQESFSKSVNHTAVLLPDETMLMPILYSLPIDKDGHTGTGISLKDHLNVTMGLSMDKTPLFNLVNNLFVMQENLQTDDDGKLLVYYKDVMKILRHPFIQYSANHDIIQGTLEDVQRKNLVYISREELVERHADFAILFRCWNGSVEEAVDTFYKVIEILSATFNNEHNVLENEYLFLFYTLLKRTDSVLGEHKKEMKVRTFRYLLFEAIRNKSVPFTGEPLSPVHIMGMLESHTLDFENVIILSCNEHILPKGKFLNSIIPFDLRVQFKLPTHQETDASYAYTFYRLFHRAKNITLVYTTASTGVGHSEKSRFLTQIEAQLSNLTGMINLQRRQVVLSLPDAAPKKQAVYKTPAMIATLEAYLAKGITPTFMSMYIESPLKFFERKVLNLKDPEEVEEMMEKNTFGIVVHKFLEDSFKDYLKKEVRKTDLEALMADEDRMQYMIEEIIKENKGGIITDRGKNYILKNVARYLLRSFLKMQAEAEAPFFMVEQESKLEVNLRVPVSDKGHVPLIISGFADRIDVKDNLIRIVDYKTGYYHPADLKAESWQELLLKPEKRKIVQLLVYKYLLVKSIREGHKKLSINGCSTVDELLSTYTVAPGFYFFKNIEAKFKGYTLADEPKENVEEFLRYVENFTGRLVRDMLDAEKPFTYEASDFGLK